MPISLRGYVRAFATHVSNLCKEKMVKVRLGHAERLVSSARTLNLSRLCNQRLRSIYKEPILPTTILARREIGHKDEC